VLHGDTRAYVFNHEWFVYSSCADVCDIDILDRKEKRVSVARYRAYSYYEYVTRIPIDMLVTLSSY
jgi:hypothetical protein